MFKLLKFVPLVALGKDVRASVNEESGKDRPFWLSRRFVGSVLTLIAGFAAIQFGVKLDAETITHLTDNITQLATTIMTLWGLVVTVIGYVKKQKTEVSK